MARMVNVEDIVFDLSGLQFIPPTDFRAIGEYFARQLRELPVIDLTKEGLLPDGTLHLFTDTDLSKVDRVWVSQNGTHFGDLYYADGELKIGKWVGIKEYCDHLNEEAEREGKGNRYMPSGMNTHVYCNQCWEPNDRRTTYCPNCSARMVQEGEDND